jgi:hypothetical protein
VIRAFVDLMAVRWMKKRVIRYTARELTPGQKDQETKGAKDHEGAVETQRD